MEERPPPYFHPNMQLYLAIVSMVVILAVCGLVAVFGGEDDAGFGKTTDVVEVFDSNSGGER